MQDLYKIIDGFFSSQDEIKEQLLHLKTKQKPSTLIISCSDSRVDPSLLLKAHLGEIFIIRNVANIVPPFQKEDFTSYHGVSAALEFAIKILNINSIIVLGHSNCGGIHALLNYDEEVYKDFHYIIDWVNILKDIKKQTQNITDREERLSLCEKLGITVSLKNLETFPFIKTRIENKTLSVYGVYFSIKNMELEYFNPSDHKFYTLRSMNG